MKTRALELTSVITGRSNEGAEAKLEKGSQIAPKCGAVDSRPLVSSFMIINLQQIEIKLSKPIQII